MNISTEWFLNEIYPIIQKRIKNLKVYLVGMNSDIFFNNFNNHAQNITATGWVKSIKKYFVRRLLSQASSIIPALVGGGLA